MKNKKYSYWNNPRYFISLNLAVRMSCHIRNKVYGYFTSILKPNRTTKVLDVGVTSADSTPDVNYFEKLYPYSENIVCVGVEDASALEEKYKGLKFIQIKPHENLPFKDKQFDIVFSHAVVEHTGSNEEQKKFIEELCRCGKKMFITTPNRYFPIEVHTGLPLIHILPLSIFRKLTRSTKFDYFSREENLNMLSSNSFKKLFPNPGKVKIIKIRIMFLFVSNLVAIYEND